MEFIGMLCVGVVTYALGYFDGRDRWEAATRDSLRRRLRGLREAAAGEVESGRVGVVLPLRPLREEGSTSHHPQGL
jgi:hypothetical protein